MASKSRIFPCNTCSLAFTTSEAQRSHMRQPWHISNLRRRVAGLPVSSEQQYASQAKSQEYVSEGKDDVERWKPQVASSGVRLESTSNSEDSHDPEYEIFEKVPQTQCLFCNMSSPALATNLDHMASIHGLFIPCADQLSDVESFLGYLAIIVFRYKECLYCNLEKSTVNGVQTHMRDKGHCMIKLDADSELLEFWDFPPNGTGGQDENNEKMETAVIKLSETEMRLPSGAVISSRSDTTQFRTKLGVAQSRARYLRQKLNKAETRAVTAGENQGMADEDEIRASPSSDRGVAIRGEMGLMGVSDSQKRALQIIEKKMKSRESVAKAALRHATEQQPVKTKYYQTENPIYQAG